MRVDQFVSKILMLCQHTNLKNNLKVVVHTLLLTKTAVTLKVVKLDI